MREGILFLGVPLVITLFLIGMQRWRDSGGSGFLGHHAGPDLGRGQLADLEEAGPTRRRPTARRGRTCHPAATRRRRR